MKIRANYAQAKEGALLSWCALSVSKPNQTKQQQQTKQHTTMTNYFYIEMCDLLYFLRAEICEEDWSERMRPIVRKYGCIMNALKHYRIAWLYDLVWLVTK